LTCWTEEEGADLAAVLTGCRSLEKLTVRGLELDLQKMLPVTGAQSIRYLDVGPGQSATLADDFNRSILYMEDGSLECLADRLPNLETLYIRRCEHMDRLGISHLVRCKKLRSLNLEADGVSNAILKQLRGLQLEDLGLGYGYYGREELFFSFEDERKKVSDVTSMGLVQVILACPSLRKVTLLSGHFEWDDIVAVLDVLSRGLPQDRDVTLCVHRATSYQSSLCGPRLHVTQI